jgi:hypothetical protein
MSTVEFDTNYWVVAPYMFLIGAGVGMMMQNLVLAVQNIIAPQDLGAASSFIAFTRSLGGAIGVSALGALLGHRVTTHLSDGLAAAGIDPATAGAGGSGIPNLSLLPEPIRGIVQSAYGSSIADVFLVAAPFGLLAFLISIFLKEVVLRGRNQDVAADTDAEEGTEQRWNAPSDHQEGHHRDASKNGRASSNGLVEPEARRAAREVVAEQQPAPAVEPGPAPLVVSGTVRQNDARPLAGAQVTLADQAGRQVARAVSDDDGRYVLPLQHGGTFLLIVAAAHLAPTASLVAVGDHPVVRDVTLAGRSAITGRVLRHDAQRDSPVGVRDALVTLTDVTGQVVGSTRSGADGGYTFERLMAGSYVLTAQSHDHRPLARSVEVAESGALACDLALTGGGRLTGTVVAASDGRGVREATVALVDAEGQVVATTGTTEDGDYLFDNLSAGRYTLTAAGYTPVALGVVVEEDAVSAVQITLGTPADSLEPGHSLPAEQR